MKVVWPTKPLAEVCEIKPPKAEARRRVSDAELVSFVPMEDLGIDEKILVPTQIKPMTEVAGSYTYFADGDVLLAKITPCFENGKLGIAENLTNGIGFGSSEYIVFRPSESIDKGWLYYYLSRESFRMEGAERMIGAVGHKRVAKEFVESYPIPVPPFSEQQRIVGILDEAFGGIAVAKANAEKNLQNAHAIFESHLQSIFIKRAIGWDSRPFECCIDDIKYTAKIQRKQFLEKGDYPIISQEAEFTNGYWNDAADVFKVNNPVVIFGDHTKVLKYVDFDFVLGADGVKILAPNKFLDPKFFFYQLRSARLKSLGYSRHYRLLKELQIRFPGVEEQSEIANRFDELSGEVQRLESLYKRKLAALDALRQSLLHQAFMAGCR